MCRPLLPVVSLLPGSQADFNFIACHLFFAGISLFGSSLFLCLIPLIALSLSLSPLSVCLSCPSSPLASPRHRIHREE